MTITVYKMHPHCQPDHVGFIPSFLNDADRAGGSARS
jgi:hypothetical protein